VVNFLSGFLFDKPPQGGLAGCRQGISGQAAYGPGCPIAGYPHHRHGSFSRRAGESKYGVVETHLAKCLVILN
jgi:hypothetical protein